MIFRHSRPGGRVIKALTNTKFGRDLVHVVLGIGGFSFGAAVITLCPLDRRNGLKDLIRSGNFIATPDFEAWLFLVAALSALCALAIVPLSEKLMVMWQHCPAKRLELLLAVAGLLAPITVLQIVMQTHSPLYLHVLRVNVLMILALSVGIACITGMLMVQTASTRDLHKKPVNAQVLYLAWLGRQLDTYLSIAGAIVGLGTLARGALRRALIASCAPTINLEKGEVVMFGMYLTMVLGIAYIPSRTALRRAGERLLSRHFSMPKRADDDWKAWQARHDVAATLLKTSGAGPLSEFRNGMAIFGPLAASALSVLLA